MLPELDSLVPVNGRILRVGQNATVTGPDGSTTTYWYGPTSSYLDSSVDGYGVGQVVDFRERST